VQGGCLGDPNGIIFQLQARGLFEGQCPATGARADDHGLPVAQPAGNRFAKGLGTVSRSDDIDEFGVLQRLIDVVARISDGAEPRDIAFGVNTGLVRDDLDIFRKLRKVEKPDFVSVGGTIERHRCAACTCSQYRDFHC
jgi:hypothetical protein